MKKIFALISAFLLCFSLFTAACGQRNDDTPATGDEEGPVEISLWTYPVGGWGTINKVSNLLTSFQKKHPNIHLKISSVDYATGDSNVEEAIAGHKAPDLILEGPERLAANWGARGLMVDLSDIWQDEASSFIAENVKVACVGEDGHSYIYPFCMTTHCMAINRDLFEAANAWQYINEEAHTWKSTEDFVKACEAVYAYISEHDETPSRVAAIFCKGQGGDQGTRALVTNLYGGTFTDKAHTRYTLDSAENIQALELLRSLSSYGVEFDKTMAGGDEATAFCNKELAMAFCWSVGMETQHTIFNPDIDFDIFPMAFPTVAGKEPSLQGGIWGFGIFNNGDEKKIEAAKTFIREITAEESAVLTSNYLPVRSDMKDLYANDALMLEYSVFSQYLGDYYQVTRGWAEARTAWWKMLQSIGDGKDITEAVEEFSNTANASVS